MTMDDKGLEDAAILLMSLGEEEASEVFKHLEPKEVQGLGETIAKLRLGTPADLRHCLSMWAFEGALPFTMDE